jgi:hypothetical protein
MAKMPNFRGHKLKIGKPGKDGKMAGTCSCGGWKGTGTTRDQIQKLWNEKHVNKFDSWK